MSAAPEDRLEQEPNRWPVPPEGGWTADDLDRIPGLPPHTELLDGSLVFMTPQTAFHGRAMRLFENALLDQAPAHLDVLREMTIKLDEKNRPEPDVLVFPVEANTGPRQTWFRPEDVVLAVEVVSDDSVERDREVKPRKYAAAGVQHFWRVEADEVGVPIVYVYELDPALEVYVPTGIHRDKLTLTAPFPLTVDLTAINRRRP
ncbi:Uma2 family endonuclease [Streptomyces rubiginosohelvolus]|uniref:Uma2 family endonuclease n=1 Tax=Streptomyces rubiginosohelvolus TaxID=67362 RepID=UPI0037AB7EA0